MNKKEFLLKKIKTAIYDFDMIAKDDNLLVWVSLWKDSMFLAYMLNELRKVIKNKFNLVCVYMYNDAIKKDKDEKFEEKRKFFEEILKIPLEKVEIKVPVNSKLNDWIWQNCQRCSYARRIAMMKTAKKYKITKIALWHHMDDIVVTSFINMISWKKLKVMPPKNKMTKSDLVFIRPLAYIREKEIKNFVKDNKIPFSKAKCLVWEDKLRNQIKKDIIWKNEKIIQNYTENIFWALIKDFQEKYKKLDYLT